MKWLPQNDLLGESPAGRRKTPPSRLNVCPPDLRLRFRCAPLSPPQSEGLHHPRGHPRRLRGHLQRRAHADVPALRGPGRQRAALGPPRRGRGAQHLRRDQREAGGRAEEDDPGQEVRQTKFKQTEQYFYIKI